MARKLRELSEIGGHNILSLYTGIAALQGIVEQLRLGFLNGEIFTAAQMGHQRRYSQQAAAIQFIANNRC